MLLKSSSPPRKTVLMDRYEKLDQVGEGTYGIVYRANDLLTGETVALKRIPIKGDEVVVVVV